jgi:hypothetical protein
MESNAPLPFFRKRAFWLSVMLVLFTLSTLVYVSLLTSRVREEYWFFFDIVFSYGGSVFVLVAPTTQLGYLFGSFYLLVMSYLLFKGFTKNKIRLIPLVIFTVVYISGLALAFSY